MIVYLDMDEVLTDFNKGVFKVFGLNYQYETFFYKYSYFSKIGQTRENVSTKCTFDFWTNLEWMHDGKAILETIYENFDIKNIYILTMPMSNVESATGKWQWIKNNIPELYSQTIITQAPKKLLAKSNTLLIDDRTQSVDEFRQAGGQTILVPRPWNSLHLFADKSVEIVKQQLAEIKCHEF